MDNSYNTAPSAVGDLAISVTHCPLEILDDEMILDQVDTKPR
jgi:hypothetical protein